MLTYGHTLKRIISLIATFATLNRIYLVATLATLLRYYATTTFLYQLAEHTHNVVQIEHCDNIHRVYIHQIVKDAMTPSVTLVNTSHDTLS